MSNPFYCSLYIDTHEGTRTMEGADRVASECGDVGELWKLGIEVVVYRNENFRPEARSLPDYDFIMCSNYRAETNAVVEDPKGLECFEQEVLNGVTRLRGRGYFVTVVLDDDVFEARLVAETGWNWTRQTPEPPGRVRRV